MKLNSSILLAVLTAIALAIVVFRANGGKAVASTNSSSRIEKLEPVVPTAADLAPLGKVEKSDAEWKAQLTPPQYAVLRRQQTERAGTSNLLSEHRHGIFRCVACDAPLSASDGKFESGTGWPSFTKPFVLANIVIAEDNTLFMTRDEVRCARCGGHLGHVFNDGPAPTGLRYCMNGVTSKFEPRP